MKSESEIREYLHKLIKYKERLLNDFTPDHEINEVHAEINTILWVLSEDATLQNNEMEMRLEKLKSEADKLGYRVVKKQPYVPFPTCTCRKGKGIERLQTVGGYFYRCPICRKESKPARLASEAAMNWNNGLWR